MSVKPGSYLYKHFKRIIVDWPVEESKSRERNLQFLLERRLKSAFVLRPGRADSAGDEDNNSRTLRSDIDLRECKMRLEALQQLANDEHKRAYPVAFTSGMNGYRLEQIQQFNSEAGRKKMGFRTYKSVEQLQQTFKFTQFCMAAIKKYYEKFDYYRKRK